MILLIDNYDSFTYNIVQYLGELGQKVQVYPNDAITLEQIASLKPDYLLIGPGPCSPKEAGISVPCIRYFSGKIPILGICLGHQAIGETFGGTIVRHRDLAVEGVQFHPEGLLTEHGRDMLHHFLMEFLPQ